MRGQKKKPSNYFQADILNTSRPRNQNSALYIEDSDSDPAESVFEDTIDKEASFCDQPDLPITPGGTTFGEFQEGLQPKAYSSK